MNLWICGKCGTCNKSLGDVCLACGAQVIALHVLEPDVPRIDFAEKK